jgi:hypothetical protein
VLRLRSYSYSHRTNFRWNILACELGQYQRLSRTSIIPGDLAQFLARHRKRQSSLFVPLAGKLLFFCGTVHFFGPYCRYGPPFTRRAQPPHSKTPGHGAKNLCFGCYCWATSSCRRWAYWCRQLAHNSSHTVWHIGPLHIRIRRRDERLHYFHPQWLTNKHPQYELFPP